MRKWVPRSKAIERTRKNSSTPVALWVQAFSETGLPGCHPLALAAELAGRKATPAALPARGPGQLTVLNAAWHCTADMSPEEAAFARNPLAYRSGSWWASPESWARPPRQAHGGLGPATAAPSAATCPLSSCASLQSNLELAKTKMQSCKGCLSCGGRGAEHPQCLGHGGAGRIETSCRDLNGCGVTGSLEVHLPNHHSPACPAAGPLTPLTVWLQNHATMQESSWITQHAIKSNYAFHEGAGQPTSACATPQHHHTPPQHALPGSKHA